MNGLVSPDTQTHTSDALVFSVSVTSIYEDMSRTHELHLQIGFESHFTGFSPFEKNYIKYTLKLKDHHDKPSK